MDSSFKEIKVYIRCICSFKGIVQLEIKMMSLFIHPQVVPNLHEVLSFEIFIFTFILQDKPVTVMLCSFTKNELRCI